MSSLKNQKVPNSGFRGCFVLIYNKKKIIKCELWQAFVKIIGGTGQKKKRQLKVADRKEMVMMEVSKMWSPKKLVKNCSTIADTKKEEWWRWGFLKSFFDFVPKGRLAHHSTSSTSWGEMGEWKVSYQELEVRTTVVIKFTIQNTKYTILKDGARYHKQVKFRKGFKRV